MVRKINVDISGSENLKKRLKEEYIDTSTEHSTIWLNKAFEEGELEEDAEIFIKVSGEHEILDIIGSKHMKNKIYINYFSHVIRDAVIRGIILSELVSIDLDLDATVSISATNIESLDISFSKTKNLYLSSIGELIISHSKFNRVHVSHRSKLEKSVSKYSIKKIDMRNVDIDMLTLRGDINQMTFDSVDILKLRIDCKITEYNSIDSSIKNANIINPSTFSIHTIASSYLGLQTTSNSKDLTTHIEYNDILMSLEKKRKNILGKVSYWFLDKTIGYGFKPIRALLFSLKSIMFFACIYGFIDLLKGNIHLARIKSISNVYDTVMILARYLYQSGITYTTIGFADILDVNPIIGLLYVIEAMLGISVLALFIVAMTRKYFFGK